MDALSISALAYYKVILASAETCSSSSNLTSTLLQTLQTLLYSITSSLAVFYMALNAPFLLNTPRLDASRRRLFSGSA